LLPTQSVPSTLDGVRGDILQLRRKLCLEGRRCRWLRDLSRTNLRLLSGAFQLWWEATNLFQAKFGVYFCQCTNQIEDQSCAVPLVGTEDSCVVQSSSSLSVLLGTPTCPAFLPPDCSIQGCGPNGTCVNFVCQGASGFKGPQCTAQARSLSPWQLGIAIGLPFMILVGIALALVSSCGTSILPRHTPKLPTRNCGCKRCKSKCRSCRAFLRTCLYVSHLLRNQRRDMHSGQPCHRLVCYATLP
jgi:hypothetical protein